MSKNRIFIIPRCTSQHRVLYSSSADSSADKRILLRIYPPIPALMVSPSNTKTLYGIVIPGRKGCLTPYSTFDKPRDRKHTVQKQVSEFLKQHGHQQRRERHVEAVSLTVCPSCILIYYNDIIIVVSCYSTGLGRVICAVMTPLRTAFVQSMCVESAESAIRWTICLCKRCICKYR